MKTIKKTITGIEWHPSRSEEHNRIFLEDGRSIDSSYHIYFGDEAQPDHSDCAFNYITGVEVEEE